ncbi:MAG: glutamate--tRNA ligase [Gemmatimonadetes bacterium]|nr:glutamate--tRNA ligase [Gemmatimonadota bacterium]NNF37185.1 glutamate--tRNA ligase [Gemmatimonadota bacterium]
MNVRTRFAPSPTGRLHLGNIRAAVFNWLFARRHDGAFVVRLEDTDVDRNVEGAEAQLLEDLAWLGVDWDEGPDVEGPHGPYRQSERMKLYRAAGEKLWAAGQAYPCFCEEGEGEESDPADPGFRRYSGRCRALSPAEAHRRVDAGEPYVMRLAAPLQGTIEVMDEVRGAISVPAEDIDDFVLLRADGRPTYNFAVVVDDVDMKITHVVRGSGHLSNTPKQALLFDAFAVPRPVFAHHAQILSPEGGKLSKRSGARAVADYRAEGFLPEALLNYLSLLGWSDPEGREVLTRDELIAAVSIERLGASDALYDPEKLRWVGSQHMARLSLDEIVAGVRPFLRAAGPPVGEWSGEVLESAVEALRTRLSAFGDVVEHLHYFAPSDEARTVALAAVRQDGSARTVIGAVAVAFAALPDREWTPAGLKAAIVQAGRDTGIRGKGLYTPVRLAVTGQEHGPDVARILHVIGREEALARLAEV